MSPGREGHDFFCVCVYCQGYLAAIEALERSVKVTSECGDDLDEEGHAERCRLMEKKARDVLEDLDAYLDAHPCKHCGGHYDIHNYLTEPEMAEAREQGCTVRICESVGERVLGRGETFYVVVTPLPANPCDESYMEDISS